MRISGLATGMDTESIIRDMMKAQSIPLDKITQKKQYLEWQLNDYRSVNRELKSMSDNLFSTVIMESTFMAKKMNISNPDAVGIKSINPNSELSGSISVTQLATQGTWQSTVTNPGLDGNETIDKLGITGSEITITALNSKGELQSKTVPIDVTTDTIKSLLDKINKGTDVNAFYDSHTGKIAMTAKNSGAGPNADSEGVGGVQDLILVTGFNDVGIAVAGKNAVFNFNGLETQRPSNAFQISGFEINLKQVTGTGAPVTFSSAPDTDKVLDTVVKFVDDYNKMIEELNKKIGEAKNRDFQPLSAEQKKDMKEKEIEQWEEKAMSGTLRNDPAIQKLLSGMRGALNGTIIPDPNDLDANNKPKKFGLSDIGITTSINWRDNGKLIIDEKTLRQAITDDPNKVHELFGSSVKKDPDVIDTDGKVTPGKVTYEGGLAVRLRAAVDEGRKSISGRAGSAGDVNDKFALGSSMKEMDNQIKRFQERLRMSEDRLWKQFTAMEMSIQKSNAQSAQLMSTFGGGM